MPGETGTGVASLEEAEATVQFDHFRRALAGGDISKIQKIRQMLGGLSSTGLESVSEAALNHPKVARTHEGVLLRKQVRSSHFVGKQTLLLVAETALDHLVHEITSQQNAGRTPQMQG